MQYKGEWLKNRGGHLLGHSFRAPPGGGVSYLDTGTLQAAGHLLGGGLSVFLTSFFGPGPGPAPLHGAGAAGGGGAAPARDAGEDRGACLPRPEQEQWENGSPL